MEPLNAKEEQVETAHVTQQLLVVPGQQTLAANRQSTPSQLHERRKMIFDALFSTCTTIQSKLSAFFSDTSNTASESDIQLSFCRAMIDGAKAVSSIPSSKTYEKLEPPTPLSTANAASQLTEAEKTRFESFRMTMLLLCRDIQSRIEYCLELANTKDNANFEECVRLARLISTLNKHLEPLPSTASRLKLPSTTSSAAAATTTTTSTTIPQASPRTQVPSTDRDGESAEKRRKRLQQGISVAHSISNRTIHTTIALFKQGKYAFQAYEPDATKNYPESGLATVRGFITEVGSNALEFPPRPLLVTDPERFDLPYADKYFGDKHYNLLGNEEKEGPCIVSIRVLKRTPSPSGTDDVILTSLVRTKRGEKQLTFPLVSSHKHSSNDINIEIVSKSFRKAFPQYNIFNFWNVEDAKLELSLKDYEDKNHTTKFKFGVLFARDGQGSIEDDMYGNAEGDELFHEFLSVLGTKIELAGWSKYRGGLNVTGENATGKYGLYTDWRGYEIMFHVSTFLPFIPNVAQQVERKRHLGNDIVILVFHSGTGTFDPSCFRSQFNHAFIVVRPDKQASKSGEPHYKVNVMIKEELKLYPPRLPRAFSFSKGEYLREFLLTKLMNSELAALKTPTFSQKLTGARKEMLQEICTIFAP